MGDTKYKSTLNGRYNELIRLCIINEGYTEIVNEYMSNSNIGDLYIDPVDIVNGNCNKQDTVKSSRLHKQAVRLTIICDKQDTLAHQVTPARESDCTLGFKLAYKLEINDGAVHLLIGDKGHQMSPSNRNILLEENKLRLVTPKKKYKRKRVHETKGYKPKIKKIKHSKRMKESLKNRIIVEHPDNILHRSSRRLNTVNDKSKETLNGFVELAILCIQDIKVNE